MNHDTRTAFSVKPTLTGERTVLRPFDPEGDLPVLRGLLRDPEIARLTGSAYDPAPTEPWDDAAEQRIRDWYGSRNDQPDRLDLAVVDRASGACVGEVVLNEWDRPNRSCNLRIALAAAGQGRGLGTEAVRLITGHGFSALGLHRVSLSVFAFNPRARRAYERAGFVAEGVRREVLFSDGVWVDDVVMAVLAPDWARHRGYPEPAG
jgi:RimJ/RimL family protein N-acetyltransferase